MDKEVKDRLKADLLWEGIVIGIAGIIAGGTAIYNTVMYHKCANDIWNGLSTHERNELRKAWIECDKNVETLADALYDAVYGIDVYGCNVNLCTNPNRRKDFVRTVKILRKRLNSPMEIEENEETAE